MPTLWVEVALLMGFLDANCNLSQLFYLLGGHALADYVLQPEWMASHKSPLFRKRNPGLGPWWWSMGAHALVNGFVVGYIMHWWVLGLLEVLVHFTTDTAKCLKHITTEQDQAIHLVSKLVWAWLG